MFASIAPGTSPLRGVRVLDLSRLLPGPFLSMILADLGADVVKVEDPGAGDYLRAIPPSREGMGASFRAINRDKRSIVLDLKSEGGVNALLRLVASSQVVIQSFRPGVMDRLGLGIDKLRQENPQAIICSISGYGQTGPYSKRAGHDINYVGTAGVIAMGGAPERPALPGLQIGDLAGGALWSAVGILAGLIGTIRSGEGCELDISMTEGAMALLATELGVGEPSRAAGTLNGGLACYGVYETKDGGFLSIGALEPKFWMALNQAIGRDGNAAEIMAPAEEQERMRKDLAERFAGKTRAEWKEIFDATECCCDVILEPNELAEHPQHQARAVFDAEGGLARLPVGRPSNRPAPKQGEHTREVLTEFGFTAEEIEELT